MLPKEAAWIYNAITSQNPETMFPLLNLGSSTLHFRTVQQPYIDETLFKPLREHGLPVVHSDIKDDTGVDLVGDIFDPEFKKTVRELGFKSLRSSNLLEHVTDPVKFASQMIDLIPSGGYLVVSVPNRYPEHMDPIDNGFRPGVDALHALFPDTDLIHGETYNAGYHFDRFRGNPRGALSFLKNAVLGLKTPEGRRRRTAFLKYEFVPFRSTSVVLRKH